MRLLLDTHAFLWWVDDDERLPKRARAAISDREHACVVSLASVWEIAIKVSLERLELTAPVDRFVAEQLALNGFEPLQITLRHAAAVSRLPFVHRDRFDRMLAAQALEDGLAIVSADDVFKKYGVKRIW